MSDTIERRYQMTRLGAGDYLLPSNDATVVWRLHRYEERDGTLTDGATGKVIHGDFWRVLRWRRPFCKAARFLDDDLEHWSQWEEWDSLLPTREAAIRSALRHGGWYQ